MPAVGICTYVEPPVVLPANQITVGNDDGHTLSYNPGSDNYFYPSQSEIKFGKTNTASLKQWTRFSNVLVPPGASIVTVKIKFHASRNQSDQNSARIWCETIGDAVAPTSYVDLVGKSWGATYVDWDDNQPWVSTNFYETPELAAIVQETINLPAWSSGNHLQFMISYKSGPNYNEAHSYSANNVTPGNEAAQLLLTYQI